MIESLKKRIIENLALMIEQIDALEDAHIREKDIVAKKLGHYKKKIQEEKSLKKRIRPLWGDTFNPKSPEGEALQGICMKEKAIENLYLLIGYDVNEFNHRIETVDHVIKHLKERINRNLILLIRKLENLSGESGLEGQSLVKSLKAHQLRLEKEQDGNKKLPVFWLEFFDDKQEQSILLKKICTAQRDLENLYLLIQYDTEEVKKRVLVD